MDSSLVTFVIRKGKERKEGKGAMGMNQMQCERPKMEWTGEIWTQADKRKVGRGRLKQKAEMQREILHQFA